MNAYDIIINSTSRLDTPNHSGWCFGLPPGISQDQWPLDPENGFPLAHGFTMILPQDYLCHGSEILGLSFFGPSFDINEGGTPLIEEVQAIFANSPEQPSDPDLLVFWESKVNQHPCLHRMKDLLECNYALILLTEQELTGPLCHPPSLTPNRFRDRLKVPAWLKSGAAFALFQSGWHSDFFQGLDVVPESRLNFDLAFTFQARSDDPNAGLSPCSEDDPKQTGYLHCENEPTSGSNKWCDAETWLHLGGTMRADINPPRMSPYYVEFEQYFGGFNFAYGTMQVDFLSLLCNMMRS